MAPIGIACSHLCSMLSTRVEPAAHFYFHSGGVWHRWNMSTNVFILYFLVCSRNVFFWTKKNGRKIFGNLFPIKRFPSVLSSYILFPSKKWSCYHENTFCFFFFFFFANFFFFWKKLFTKKYLASHLQ